MLLRKRAADRDIVRLSVRRVDICSLNSLSDTLDAFSLPQPMAIPAERRIALHVQCSCILLLSKAVIALALLLGIGKEGSFWLVACFYADVVVCNGNGSVAFHEHIRV